MPRGRAPVLRRLMVYGSLAIAITLVGAAFVIYAYAIRAATLDFAELSNIPERSMVIDTHGKIYSRIQGENRVVVPLSEVSQHFLDALLAREDTRFYHHNGVDYRAVVRAIVQDLRHWSLVEGGSTLTQQLARNSFPLGGSKSFQRKLFEAMVAYRIEAQYSKDEILEFYVNRIYFGTGVWGIETASQFYFGKPSSDLSLGEAAMLAGIIRSPNRLSPRKDLNIAMAQRDAVLARMTKLGMISKEEATAARRKPIRIATNRPQTVQESYAMDAVRRELEELLSSDQIDRGGLRVFTTIDADLQRLAERVMERNLERIEKKKRFPHPSRAKLARSKVKNPTDYLQGSLIAIDNRTGGIVAIVGGRNFKESQFNRALQAKRQIGSTFKPFIYAAAIKKGLLPGTLVNDSPLEPGELGVEQVKWNPENAKDNYLGQQPAEIGLIQSRNMMAVRVGEIAGIDQVSYIAGTVGLDENLPKVPAIYLGAFEASLEDLTTAYTIFPNGGTIQTTHIIERVEDRQGRVIYQAAHDRRIGLEVDVAWVVCRMMEQVLQQGTAASAEDLGFDLPAGGKTGTTNHYRDAWFVGYTTSLTCGVWVGFDQPREIMAGGYGSTLALPAWVEFMKDVPDDSYPANEFPSLVNLSEARLCSRSGMLASGDCENANAAYEAELPATLIPSGLCTAHTNRRPESLIVASAQIVRPAAEPPVSMPDPAPPPPPEPPRTNEPVRIQVGICSLTGLLAHAGCMHGGACQQTMRVPAEIPRETCHVHHEVVQAQAVRESELPAVQ